MSAPPRVGSLFTGYGGLDAAPLHLLGEESRVVWHSEISPAACALLEHRDPGVPNLGDLTMIDPAKIEPVDALTFGWPCQPHSAAGKRLGSEDPRALWPHVHQLIARLRPRYLFGENVARVASNGELRRVARSLAAIGYVGAWHCLRASAVGAPHRRDRLFLLAVRADAVGTAPDAEGLGRAARWAEPAGPGGELDAAGVGPVSTGGAAGLTLFKTPTAQLGVNGGSQHPDKRKAGGHGPTLADEVEWLLPTPEASDATGGRVASEYGGVRASGAKRAITLSSAIAHRWGQYSGAVQRWEQVTGRSAPDPTQVGARGVGQVLAPAFVEWMMGLPAGWVTEVPGLTRSQQLAMLGNGVVPQQALAAFQILATRMFHVEHVAA